MGSEPSDSHYLQAVTLFEDTGRRFAALLQEHLGVTKTRAARLSIQMFQYIVSTELSFHEVHHDRIGNDWQNPGTLWETK
jgi:hypothetical protein